MALPSGYTKLEYIESTGTQYIDTGVKPNQNTRVIIDCWRTGATSTYPFPFGSRTGLPRGLDVAIGASQVFYHYGGNYKFADFSAAGNRMTIDANKNIATFTSNGASITITLAAATFQEAYGITLFSLVDNGAVFTDENAFVGNIYSCKIYDNGALVRDFIPCKNTSGVVGMWDDTNSQFYTNAGAGAFTAGPEVQPAGPLSSRSIGSSVYLNIGGARKEFLVVHQGLPSSLYDSSCDGTWLLMKDIYENRVWNSSNVNVYETSTINTYLNGPFLGLFDADIQGIIKQVKIPYRKGGGNGPDQSGANGLSCKAFLLSVCEVGLSPGNNVYYPNDGTKLDFFNANTGFDQKRIAYLNGAVTPWGLRSQNGGDTTVIWLVTDKGNGTISSASLSYGIRPCIILPSTTQVDDRGNVVTVALTAHKTLINGTAYTVKGGKCMVDGTVYNILKGRTLIDGTAWDITFPEQLVMPAKGDLITMNLDGTDRLYRVLKIVSGTTVEVLSMEDAGSSAFGSTNTYAGNILDAYLNTTWYNTLSAAAKAAIVPKNIAQYRYDYSASVYNATTHSSFAVFSTKALHAGIGDRYVYALGVEDIEDYFNHTFSNTDIWQLFWNTTAKPSGGGFPWLRDASTRINKYAWQIDYSSGYVGDSVSYNSNGIRPAFQIDLSKIDFTIGGSVSKTWTFDTSKAPTSMFPNASLGTTSTTTVSFVSNRQTFLGFGFNTYAMGTNLTYIGNTSSITVYEIEEGWSSSYKTVTFDEAPSGDLLTWLQANATPQ